MVAQGVDQGLVGPVPNCWCTLLPTLTRTCRSLVHRKWALWVKSWLYCPSTCHLE